MKIKVSEATPTQLDWLVAKCEGYSDYMNTRYLCEHRFSTDWAQGGPIIERERIELIPLWLGSSFEGYAASHRLSIKYDDEGEFVYGSDCKQYSLSPLIASMTCYVTFRLGNEVEVPKEIL